MNKEKVGQLIREARGNDLQKTFVDTINETSGLKLDNTRLSLLETGKEKNDDLYKKVCEGLGIRLPDVENRLRVAFSQGFWAAPVIAINEGIAPIDFFEHLSLSSYTDKATGKIIFSEKNARLPPFDKQKHAFYYSGEIVDMLHSDKIDIGFLGSTVVEDDKDLVRIARLNDAGAMRHAMVVVAPKGQFSTSKEAIAYLLRKKPMHLKAHIYYHPKSTAAREFRSLLQHTEHWHDTLDVLDLERFKEDFKEKLIKNKGKLVGHIGLMLSVECAKEAVKELDKDEKTFSIFTFRTSDIVTVAKEMKIKELDVTPFFYEMVVRRSNDKIKRLASDDKGFQYLLKYLRQSVTKLSDIKNDKGIPLEHRKVAQFFDLDIEQVSEMLKKMEFELVYYPEWVNKVLGII
jgi:hypothetical protein